MIQKVYEIFSQYYEMIVKDGLLLSNNEAETKDES